MTCLLCLPDGRINNTIAELPLQLITSIAKERRLLSQRHDLLEKDRIILSEEVDVVHEFHVRGGCSHAAWWYGRVGASNAILPVLRFASLSAELRSAGLFYAVAERVK